MNYHVFGGPTLQEAGCATREATGLGVLLLLERVGCGLYSLPLLSPICLLSGWGGQLTAPTRRDGDSEGSGPVLHLPVACVSLWSHVLPAMFSNPLLILFRKGRGAVLTAANPGELTKI